MNNTNHNSSWLAHSTSISFTEASKAFLTPLKHLLKIFIFSHLALAPQVMAQAQAGAKVAQVPAKPADKTKLKPAGGAIAKDVAVAAVTEPKSENSVSYVADLKEIGNADSPNWQIALKAVQEGPHTRVSAVNRLGSEELFIEQALVKNDDASTLEYSAEHKQLGDKGTLKINGNKATLEYTENGGPLQKKEIKLTKTLLTPGNFEIFARTHFEKLKAERQISVDFFVWERKDTVSFILSYEGLVNLNGEKTHLFKLKIDSLILSAFVNPIQMWYSEDMKFVRQFKGRVAIKKKSPSGSLESVDALVTYNYK